MKYESGERRLDVIEFVRVATVLKVAPEDVSSQYRFLLMKHLRIGGIR